MADIDVHVRGVAFLGRRYALRPTGSWRLASGDQGCKVCGVRVRPPDGPRMFSSSRRQRSGRQAASYRPGRPGGSSPSTSTSFQRVRRAPRARQHHSSSWFPPWRAPLSRRVVRSRRRARVHTPLRDTSNSVDVEDGAILVKQLYVRRRSGTHRASREAQSLNHLTDDERLLLLWRRLGFSRTEIARATRRGRAEIDCILAGIARKIRAR